MATGTVSFRYFILSLLAHQPMTGYDIKQFLESLVWLVGSPSFGAIYPALHALFEDELVTVEVLSQPDKPMRKIYTITPKGRYALQQWIEQPVSTGTSIKSFVMQLILVGDFSKTKLIEHLECRRTVVAMNRSALEQMIEDLDGLGNLGQQLAIEYGLATSDAELTWLDETLARLSQEVSAESSKVAV